MGSIYLFQCSCISFFYVVSYYYYYYYIIIIILLLFYTLYPYNEGCRWQWKRLIDFILFDVVAQVPRSVDALVSLHGVARKDPPYNINRGFLTPLGEGQIDDGKHVRKLKTVGNMLSSRSGQISVTLLIEKTYLWHALLNNACALFRAGLFNNILENDYFFVRNDTGRGPRRTLTTYSALWRGSLFCTWCLCGGNLWTVRDTLNHSEWMWQLTTLYLCNVTITWGMEYVVSQPYTLTLWC